MGGREPQAQGGSENEKKRNDFIFFPESKEDKENSEQAWSLLDFPYCS